MSDTRRKNSWRKKVNKWNKEYDRKFPEYAGTISKWYSSQFRAETEKFLERDGCGNGGEEIWSKRAEGTLNGYRKNSENKKKTVRYERRKNRKNLEKRVDNDYT